VYCPDGIIHRRDGAYEVDRDYCKGCGICVVECPRAAMEMVQG
jgi:Pyruvate/2-oxoacid:ferredoxin oxidoreductase delta subunit